MLRFFAFFFVFAISMCSKTNMSGDAKKPVVAPTPTAFPTVTPGVSPTPPCNQNGVTQVRLLTPTLDLNAVDAHLDFEVSKTSCDGSNLDFSADKIWFDMDAYGMDDVIPYEATGLSGVDSGNFNQLIGEDLFGHTGSTWAHFETQRPMQIRGKGTSIQIRIKLAGMTLLPRVEGSTSPAPSNAPTAIIPTYLRFGNSAPATATVNVILKK